MRDTAQPRERKDGHLAPASTSVEVSQSQKGTRCARDLQPRGGGPGGKLVSPGDKDGDGNAASVS